MSQDRPRFPVRSVTIEPIRPAVPPGGGLPAAPGPLRRRGGGSVDAGGPPGWSPGPAAPSSPGVGRGPRHAAPSRRRRLLVILLAVTLGAVAVVVAGGWGYAHWRFGQIASVDLPGLSKPPPPGEPQVLLVVGSDSRAELDQPGDATKFGTTQDAGGVRGDVIMLVRIDPGAHTVKVLSVPRDLLVPNAATGGRSKINAVFAGGPQQLIQTIQQYLGIPVNHYLLVNFDGFRAIIDALGGIRMDFPYPAEDDLSGLHITTAGCHRLGGDRALAGARSRHYRYLADGSWHSDPLSDLGRIKRQQVFLRVVLQTALSRGLANPVRANRFIGAVVGHLTKDRGLTQANAISLARQFRGFDPDQLGDQTLPVVVANDYQGFGDVLLLPQPAAPPSATQPASSRPRPPWPRCCSAAPASSPTRASPPAPSSSCSAATTAASAPPPPRPPPRPGPPSPPRPSRRAPSTPDPADPESGRSGGLAEGAGHGGEGAGWGVGHGGVQRAQPLGAAAGHVAARGGQHVAAAAVPVDALAGVAGACRHDHVAPAARGDEEVVAPGAGAGDRRAGQGRQPAVGRDQLAGEVEHVEHHARQQADVRLGMLVPPGLDAGLVGGGGAEPAGDQGVLARVGAGDQLAGATGQPGAAHGHHRRPVAREHGDAQLGVGESGFGEADLRSAPEHPAAPFRNGAREHLGGATR